MGGGEPSFLDGADQEACLAGESLPCEMESLELEVWCQAGFLGLNYRVRKSLMGKGDFALKVPCLWDHPLGPASLGSISELQTAGRLEEEQK